MMKGKRLLCALLLAALGLNLTGCGQAQPQEAERVTLVVKTTPIGLGNVPGVGEAEVYDLFVRADIDESIWAQNTVDGRVYILPYQQLQNTLMVNRDMMEAAGLAEYIPPEDTVAHWSTAEFNHICQTLKGSLTDENTFALMMYAANNQGDSRNRGLDVFAANFPSLDGQGYCTITSNGFCIFDNGDEAKIQAAKDFIRFIYEDEELMNYTLGTLPVNHSVIQKHREDIWMLALTAKTRLMP